MYTYSIYTKRKGPIHLQFYSPRKKSYFIPILLILRLCLLSPMLSKSRGFGVSLCPAPLRHRAPRRRHRARMGDAVVVLCAPTILHNCLFSVASYDSLGLFGLLAMLLLYWWPHRVPCIDRYYPSCCKFLPGKQPVKQLIVLRPPGEYFALKKQATAEFILLK